MSDNIDQLPEEGNAYLKPSTSLVKDEERSDAVEVLNWLLEKARERDEIIMYRDTIYLESDREGDAPLDAKRIVELYKNRNK